MQPIEHAGTRAKPPIESGRMLTLTPLDDVPAGQSVPVRINAVVTELGILELWMKHAKSDRRWKVEFQVRTE